MNDIHAALYARVSSEQQAGAGTIASQLAALYARVAADGLAVADTLAFIDDGYSGATLVRPALERLRDAAAAGEIDALYVLCPDRLARHYAHQAVLLEELTRADVDVRFLDYAGGGSPEDHLLLQVQGVIAEYERATFPERSRRGKRYAAQPGRVSVLGQAPYGYRYVRGAEGGGDARFDIDLEEARVVRQVFAWVGQERCTLAEVCRRLEATGVRTRTGQTTWDRKTIWAMLRHPAYSGHAVYGRYRKTRLQPRLRAPRPASAVPARLCLTRGPGGGVGTDPGPRASGRGALRGRGGATPRKPAARLHPAQRQSLPTTRAGRLRALRLCLLRPHERFTQRLLPLLRIGCVALRGHAAVLQQGSAPGPP